MTETTTTTPVVTDDEVAAINAARDALLAIENRASDAAWNAPSGAGDDRALAQYLGRIAGVATIAGDMLFDVLNVARVYGRAPLTDDQIHNRHGEEQ